MSSENFEKLVMQKLENIEMEEAAIRKDMESIRKEMREELTAIKTSVGAQNERLMKLEWRFQLQQRGLYAISAAIGAALWKIPTLLNWLKSQF